MGLGTEVEQGGLTAWSRAQEAALYHRHLVEQTERDERKAEKDAKDKKAKKKKDKQETQLEKITAASVVAKILHKWCPALWEFLDTFGEPHAVLPVFLALHILYWATAPWYLSLLLPLPMTHILPICLSLKSLYSPASLLEKAHEDATRAWDKECADLKKKGKQQAEFPDPPDPVPLWQVCVRDRNGWLAYWVLVGGVEYLELLCFGDQAAGLIWWPTLKAVFLVSLYFVWEEDEKHQTTGAMKLVEKFLPEPRLDKKEKEKKKEKERQEAKRQEKKEEKKREA